MEPGSKEQVIMAGGSDSYHLPLAKLEYERALVNLYRWCRFGEDKPNFIGIMAVQWCGNQQDKWLPDYLTTAEYGWTPDKPEYSYTDCLARCQAALSRLNDYNSPADEEVGRSAWDGIWLDENGQWEEDIMGLAHPFRKK
jgi:hypothetical protein